MCPPAEIARIFNSIILSEQVSRYSVTCAGGKLTASCERPDGPSVEASSCNSSRLKYPIESAQRDRFTPP